MKIRKLYRKSGEGWAVAASAGWISEDGRWYFEHSSEKVPKPWHGWRISYIEPGTPDQLLNGSNWLESLGLNFGFKTRREALEALERALETNPKF